MNDKKILYLYGDSNTYGYNPQATCYEDARLPEHSRWVTALREHMRDSVQIIEDGLNGRCLPRHEAEIKRIRKAMERYEKPDYFAVMLGTNDLLDQLSPDPTEIAFRMEQLLRAVKDAYEECLCIVISPPRMGFPAGHPMNLYQEANEKLSCLYRDIAGKYEAEFIDAGKWDIDLFYDGLHISEKGNGQFAGKMVDAFTEIFVK